MNNNLHELYIKNSSEFKGFQKKFLEVWNKYQNKFAYRKVQTNNWVDWAYNHPEAFFGGLEREQNKKLLNQVKTCCNYKVDWFKITDKGLSIRFAYAITCKKYKLCANCARLKANQNIAKFSKFLEDRPELLSKNWYYMVLTLKHSNEDNLEDLFFKLNNSINKIRGIIKDSKRGENNTSPFRFIEGALIAIESTHNKNTGWHPHVNFLFCSDHNFDLSKKGATQINEQITGARLKITGDSFITSIQKVQVKDKLHEILKYITKFSTLEDIKRLELFIKTHKFRFLRKWGLLYGAPIDEDKLERTIRQQYEIPFPTEFKNGKYVFTDKNIDEFWEMFKDNAREDIPPELVEKLYQFFDKKDDKKPSSNTNDKKPSSFQSEDLNFIKKYHKRNNLPFNENDFVI